jgi:hypothetical protein
MTTPTFVYETMVDALGKRDADMSWLSLSAVHPELFLAALARHADGIAERPLASQLGVNYDFFHDLCARFCDALRPLCAVSEPRASAPWLTVSYPELGSRATRLHAWWLRQGLERGHCLCVVADPSVEFAITVLAALRMGLVLACLPPRAPSFVRARVAALSPDAVIVEDCFRPWLREVDRERIVPPMDASYSGPSVPPDAHVYDAQEPALRAFGPYGPNPLEPLVVIA